MSKIDFLCVPIIGSHRKGFHHAHPALPCPPEPTASIGGASTFLDTPGVVFGGIQCTAQSDTGVLPIAAPGSADAQARHPAARRSLHLPVADGGRSGARTRPAVAGPAHTPRAAVLPHATNPYGVETHTACADRYAGDRAHHRPIARVATAAFPAGTGGLLERKR